MVEYALTGDAKYWRYKTATSLMWAMFKHVRANEVDGKPCEFVFVTFAPHKDDRDYMGVVFTGPQKVAT